MSKSIERFLKFVTYIRFKSFIHTLRRKTVWVINLKNPKTRPSLEFWQKVYPQVYKFYKKRGLKFAKKRGFKSVKEIASATTASIWHEKISPTRKAIYERLRRKREAVVKVKRNPLVEYYKIVKRR